MTRKSIAGPSKEEPGRAYLLHTDEFRAFVDSKRDEALRAVADLRSEVAAFHEGISRRNADTARANEKDGVEIQARESHIADYESVITAADAALQASAK